MSDEANKDALVQVYEGYLAAFSAGDFQSVAKYFSLPALLVQATGSMAIPNQELLTGVMKNLLDSLPENFAETKLIDFNPTRMSDDCAAAHIKYNRLSNSGEIISKEQSVYYFVNVDGQWKIEYLERSD